MRKNAEKDNAISITEEKKEKKDEAEPKMSLLRQGKALALTIYIGESDQWQGTPLYVAIIQLLREQGCAGATAMRAVAGYGAGGCLHESGNFHWSSDAPIVL